MMKKYCFNMIEIILAISIIAIGISSVMVLFTSGVRAGNAAVTSNNMPNVTESLLSHIRLLVLSYGTVTGWNSSYSDAVPTISDADWKKTEDDVIDKKFGNADKSDGRVIFPCKSGVKGYFLYRQLVVTKENASTLKPEEYGTVFQAMAKIRDVTPQRPVISDLVDHKTKWSGTDPRDSDNNDALSQALKVVEVEISYPADVAPYARERKKYRIMIFNDKYDRFAYEYVPAS